MSPTVVEAASVTVPSAAAVHPPAVAGAGLRGLQRRCSGAPAEALVLASVLLATSGQLCLKRGLAVPSSAPGKLASLTFSISLPWLHGQLSVGAFIGLLLYGLGTLLWVAAVRRRNLSYLYPLASLNYILVALGGHFLLGEPLHSGRWLGIGIMAAGIALLARTASANVRAGSRQ